MVLAWDRLRFESAAEPFVLPLADIRLNVGTDEHWIELRDQRAPGLTFSVDRALLDEPRFVQAPPIRQQLQRMLGRQDLVRRLRATGIALAGFVLVAWLVTVLAGWAVQTIVKGIPADREIAFGDESFQKLAPDVEFVNDPNAQARLEAIGALLRPSVPAPGIPFRFHIIVGEPNAFAMPGGHIVVTTGLLNLLDTPEQLAGVLAHESAHVARRHMFQHLISGKGPVFLLELLTGGRNQLFNLMAYPSELLVYESFSQKYEREADNYGWDYLVAAGINPQGLTEALGKLRHYEGDGNVLNFQRGKAFASHPDLDQRIIWLEAKWQALPHPNGFVPLTNAMPKVTVNAPSRLEMLLK